MFAPEIYEERRNQLQERLRTGLLLFLGNDESPMNSPGNMHAFRQDSTFLYFAGVDYPGFSLLMDLDQGSTTLFADEPSLDAIIWTGMPPSVPELAWKAGISHAAPATKLADRLNKAVAQGRSIRFLPPYRAENKLKLFLLLGFHPEHQALTASVDFIKAIVEQRAYKIPEEIAEIERAVDLSVDMHTAAMRMARPGMAEAEIVARVTEIALASGSDLSHPIVATTHGEVIRNRYHDLILENGHMFLLNAGAETPHHYPGDLTSSFPVNRTFSARQKEVYQIVLNALQDSLGVLKPGLWFQDAHLTACKTLVAGLKALGLMKGSVDEAVAQGAHALFFPHGLGHMLGLDVHDMEDLGEEWVGYEGRPRSSQFGLKSLRLAREMRPGFVFTLEPGLYFIPELMDRWQADEKFTDFIDYPRLEPYRTFGGIRIGDNYMMQEHGVRRLGKPMPRIPSEIEVVRGRS
jgi:Xaa-Pro aminopeptidase